MGKRLAKLLDWVARHPFYAAASWIAWGALVLLDAHGRATSVMSLWSYLPVISFWLLWVLFPIIGIAVVVAANWGRLRREFSRPGIPSLVLEESYDDTPKPASIREKLALGASLALLIVAAIVWWFGSSSSPQIADGSDTAQGNRRSDTYFSLNGLSVQIHKVQFIEDRDWIQVNLTAAHTGSVTRIAARLLVPDVSGTWREVGRKSQWRPEGREDFSPDPVNVGAEPRRLEVVFDQVDASPSDEFRIHFYIPPRYRRVGRWYALEEGTLTPLAEAVP